MIPNTQRLMVILIRLSEVSPFVRTFTTALKWQEGLMKELFALGEKEIEAGLSLSSKYHTKSQFSREEYQISLLSNYIIPLAKEAVKCAEELHTILHMAETNLQKWQGRVS